MELNEYQNRAMKTCMESSNNPLYMLFGLCEETGELQGKFSKAIRKGMIHTTAYNHLVSTDKEADNIDELHNDIKKECGDVAWMLAGVCKVMGWTLEEVCQLNLDKLADRQKRGVIIGSGDSR